MSTPRRIFINAMTSYGTTVLGMALGLFSSRWVLQGLGAVDYGLMGVVGALIIFVTFLNQVMSNASARFFAFSIGAGDFEDTKQWFNVSIFIHLLLPSCLLCVGWPLGEWAVGGFLNIPAERLGTAHWVLRLSLLSAFFSMVTTPYIGMCIAKQKIAEISIWGVLGSIANFGLAYAVLITNRDSWLLYCAGTVCIVITIRMIQVYRAYIMFQECRISRVLWRDPKRIRKVLSFSGWTLFGAIGGLLRGNGIAILLNKYFAPSQFPQVNASYSIGSSLSGYTQTLSTALMTAFSPEITSTEGRGDRLRMLKQASLASKFGTFLILLLAIPLFLEVDYVLLVWLKEPPAFAASMCTLSLITFMIDRVTAGQMIAVAAKGQVASYQMMLGGFLLLTLPIAWLFLAYGFNAVSVFWAYIITMTLCSVGRVFLAERLVDYSPLVWLKEVFIPCAVVLVCGLLFGYLVQTSIGEASFIRLFVVTLATLISSFVLGWLFIMSVDERRYFISCALNWRQRLFS